MAALGGATGISVHEYPTTAGVTFEIAGVYVNAPFDQFGCDRSPLVLDREGDRFCVSHSTIRFDDVTVLPLPGYIGQSLSSGAGVDNLVMTHVHRVRLSPIKGCAFDCSFCSLADLRYERRRLDDLLEALEIARSDPELPVRHALISGGTPGRAHVNWFNSLCAEIIESTDLPVDVMFSPQHIGVATVDALV